MLAFIINNGAVFRVLFNFSIKMLNKTQNPASVIFGRSFVHSFD